MKGIVEIGIFLLNVFYRMFWICPVKEKVVMISRESNQPSVDIARLCQRMEKKNPQVKVVVLCKMIGPGLGGKIAYGFHMVRQMYHLATAKVAVLDTYCICASVLKHRRSLQIIQMWHAVGCMKKFGYSILDKEEGSNRKVAEWMRMHKNYDHIFVSSECCKPHLAEAYRTDVSKMRVLPLPRLDILIQKEEIAESAAKIRERYPQLQGKKTILYVPTFRKNKGQDEEILRLIAAMDLQNYNFVVKYHPIAHGQQRLDGAIVDQTFTSLEWMSVSDYVITDYSAVTYEAAIAGKPLFFYAYDLEEYEDGRSFYIDYLTEMPGEILRTPEETAEAIARDRYDIDKVHAFARRYVEEMPDYTEAATEFILRLVSSENH